MAKRVGGRYDLVEEIATGGKAKVFRAIDSVTDTPVMVRIFQLEGEDDIEGFLRFQQEGALLTTLKHPNIVQIYRTLLDGQTGYMVAEAVAGRPLSVILGAERLIPSQIKAIALQLAAALIYGHGRSIVHRDLNPDNIVITNDYTVKLRALTEMGMARIMKVGSSSSSVTGMTLGAPIYLAPEQITEQPADNRVDVYSFGAVLYHMVTGQPPFAGRDGLAIGRNVVSTTPPRPGALVPHLPPDWEAVIVRAMEKDPANRFQSMIAMEQAIAALDVPGGLEPSAAAVAATKREVVCSECGRVGSGKFCRTCGTRLSG